MSKRAEKEAIKEYPTFAHDTGKVSEIIKIYKRKGFQKGYDMGAKHMLKSAREWWKARLRGFVSDGIAEGMVDEFCEDMKEDYE